MEYNDIRSQGMYETGMQMQQETGNMYTGRTTQRNSERCMGGCQVCTKRCAI